MKKKQRRDLKRRITTIASEAFPGAHVELARDDHFEIFLSEEQIRSFDADALDAAFGELTSLLRVRFRDFDYTDGFFP
jgi:hypothetical protein